MPQTSELNNQDETVTEGLNAACDLVEDFYRKIGEHIPNHPQSLASETLNIRKKWLLEEIDELLVASSAEDQIDALCDILYYTLGSFVLMGIHPGKAFEAVHSANLRKLSPDQKLEKRQDGKVIKHAKWSGPEENLKALLADGALDK